MPAYMMNLFLLLLLGLVSLALAPPPSRRDRTKTGYACEGSTLSISCPSGTIEIKKANWGRLKRDICHHGRDTEDWSTDCFSTRALVVVSNMCDGKSRCWVTANNRMFHDPCSTTPKYLEVHWDCVKESTTKSYATRPTTTPVPTTTTTPTTTTPSTTTTTPSTTTTTTTTTTTPSTTTTPTTTSTTKATTTKMKVVTHPPVIDAPNCKSLTRRSIYWPETPAGAVSTQPCPINRDATATRVCGRNGIWHEKADMSKCLSPRTMELKQRVHNKEAVERVAPELAQVTQEGALYGGDVVELTSLMSDIVNQVEIQVVDLPLAQREQATKDVSENVVRAGSNLLAKENKASWDDLPQSDQAQAATRLVDSVERSGFQLADTIEEPLMAPIISIEVNIIMEVNVVSTSGYIDGITFPSRDTYAQQSAYSNTPWTSKSDCIHLPGNSIKAMGVNDGLARLVFATYSNLQELLAPQQDQPRYETLEEETNIIDVIDIDIGDYDVQTFTTTTSRPKLEVKKRKEQYVNSNIISASINNRTEKIIPLPEPITYTLEHSSQNNIYNPSCAFWEYSERTMTGEWSSFGCKLVDTNLTHTVCQCEHLTNFAVLMDVVGVDMTQEHIAALTYITYIGCLISIVCLVIAWLTFQFCKNLQCDRNTIHKNLVFCLFVAEIVFLCGIAQHDKAILCSVIAGVLHYLFLAAFAWMCLEGVQLYMMLVEVFEAERSRVKYYYVAAYGIPAIIVAISAAVYHEGYGTKQYCWLSTENGFIWAFVGPVMAVISVNIVMLSIAIYVMCRHASIASSLKMKEKSRLENIKSWVKGASVLVVLLGLTWTFGVLFLGHATLVFAYIFTILNSLQGLFIFVFHCAMNEKVRKEYKRCARHMTWLPDCIRVKYGGAKPYTSTSPPSTSSGTNYFQRLLSGRRRKRSSTTTLQRSSTPSTKSLLRSSHAAGDGNYQHMPARYSGGPDEPAPPPPMGTNTLSNFSTTEDPEGYLEPRNLRINDSIYAEPDECLGELSMMDGSVIDSNCVSDYIRDGGMAAVPPIDVDKYKIKPPPKKPKLHQLNVDDPHISESEYSDGELFNMTGGTRYNKQAEENVYEECPPVSKPPASELEKNLLNNLLYNEDSLKKKRFSTSSGNSSCSDSSSEDCNDSISKDSPSLNDLNKGDSDSSRNSIYLSTPNIKYKNGSGDGPENNKDSKNSSLQRSLPNLNDIPPEQIAIEKLHKAASSKEDGLINLSHGKKVERQLSKETKEALNGHPYRLTSSDC